MADNALFHGENVKPAAGVYLEVAPTFEDGDVAVLQTDVNGALKVVGTFSGGAISVGGTSVASPTVASVAVDNAGNDVIAAADPARKILSIFNTSSSVTLYIGPTGVTNADGFPIPPQSGIVFGVEDTAAAKAWYGYAASSIDVRKMSL